MGHDIVSEKSKVVSKSLKLDESIAKQIKLGGALTNKSQSDFISYLVSDFFQRYKAKELGQIIDDIDTGKIKTYELE